MYEWVILAVLILLGIIAGGICGIAALVRTFSTERNLLSLRGELHKLRKEVERLTQASREAGSVSGEPPPFKERPPAQAPQPPPDVQIIEELVPPPPKKPVETVPHDFAKPPTGSPPAPPKPRQDIRSPAQLSLPSLELALGTKWLVWVGVGFLLAATGFFVKYAYDNAWIGPQGRIAIGTILGIGLLGAGERFRRKDWQVLFQSLTGCGIGVFYICIFAAFQIYHLTGQGVAMALAVLVTLLAVTMAVAYDAVAIAILGLIGGFLSPILLSTGTNRPYALFTYIAVLDLTAMGSAYFRRWRALNMLSFWGTALIYIGWYEKFYASDQMTPALLYTSLFYLMFLLIPALNSLVQRTSETIEGLALIAVNAVWSFFSYYRILYDDYRYTMGFVVLGQAILVFLLFQVWMRRVGKDSRTAESFLIITLALVTIAVPIELKLYGIPIAWAMEGAVLVALGIHFNQKICRIGGVAALLLAAGALIHRLPLHRIPFTPVFNLPFGSWIVVIAAAIVATYYLLYRDREDAEHRILGTASVLLAFVLGCVLLSLEVSDFWTVHRPNHFRNYQYDSLIVLWALIPSATVLVLDREQLRSWMPLAWVCYAVGVWMFFTGISHYDLPTHWLMLNPTFLSKLVFIIALWWGAEVSRRAQQEMGANVMEVIAHGLLAVLLAAEMMRWAERYWSSTRVGMSLISAIWAAQAFALIWFGLFTRMRLRRILGFVLFGVCVGKILIVDMSTLQAVYRILSFFAGGALLIAAGYFYQRYAQMLLGEEETGKRGKP